MERHDKGENGGGDQYEYERKGRLIGDHITGSDDEEHANERKKKPKGKKRPWWQRWGLKALQPMSLFTIALVVVAILQWDTTRRQLNVMKDQMWQMQEQIDEAVLANDLAREVFEASESQGVADRKIAADRAKESLDASKRALDASIEASQTAQRAYLVRHNQGFDEPDPNLAPPTREFSRFSVIFKNVGRSPATKVYTYRMLTVITRERVNAEKSGLDGLIDRLFSELRNAKRAESGDVASDGTYTITAGLDRPYLSEAEEELLRSPRPPLGRVSLLSLGGVIYQDIWGKEHETQFCLLSFGPNAKNVVHFCNAHNFIR